MYAKIACRLKWAGCLSLALLFAGAPVVAQATLITFEALPIHSPGDPDDSVNFVQDQYSDQGLTVSAGYIDDFERAVVSGSQVLAQYRSPMSLEFADSPNYVSMYVTSAEAHRIYVSASGDGYSETINTLGYFIDLEHLEDDSLPDQGLVEQALYRDRQRVAFYSPTGIDRIDFATFFTYHTVFIDDLYFGSVPAVPEPSVYALMGLGLLGVRQLRRRRQLSGGDRASGYD